jgi:hypothetical protein
MKPTPAERNNLDRPAGSVLIGWKEYLAFPDWQIPRVKAKIDTGARTSALDVLRYELRQDARHGLMADLHVCLSRRHPEATRVLQTPVVRMVTVRNTSGQTEQRPLIETTIRLGPVEKRVLLTVSNRSSMCFRMILGRTALAGDFVVDVSRKYLLRG